MASSNVAIVNSALLKVGAKKLITSLTDDTPNGNVANTLYEPIRDDLLRAHLWNFAVARQKLAQSATTPTYEYDYAYPFPADWLRTIKVHDNTDGGGQVEYRIEGTSVLSSATEIWLTYVKIVTDTNAMTADFRELLSLRLAVEFAIPVANSKSLKDLLNDEYRRTLRRTKSSDAIEDFPERIPDGSWVRARQHTDDDEYWNR